MNSSSSVSLWCEKQIEMVFFSGSSECVCVCVFQCWSCGGCGRGAEAASAAAGDHTRHAGGAARGLHPSQHWTLLRPPVGRSDRHINTLSLDTC